MKDNFSGHSGEYASYRPTYPQDFFDYLRSLIPQPRNAWECGTGNGQAAYELARFFDQVYATDISAPQLAHARKAGNIVYSVQPAEKTDFPDHLFDLILVAQAIHWFDFEKFYREARRTARPGALLCVLGYGRLEISPEIDPVIDHFYQNTIGSYWDDERRYIEEEYKTIPFPFEEIHGPSFSITCQWTLPHLTGYLDTWSAVKHFIRQNHFNPVEELHRELQRLWSDDSIRTVRFPLLLRIGKVNP